MCCVHPHALSASDTQSHRRPWGKQSVASFVREMRFLSGYLGQLARAHGLLLPLGSAGAAKAGFQFQLCRKWDGREGFRDAHGKAPSGKISRRSMVLKAQYHRSMSQFVYILRYMQVSLSLRFRLERASRFLRCDVASRLRRLRHLRA